MKVVKSDRKNRGMDLDGIVDLLNRVPVGRVGTISPDGRPYVVPVNFAYNDGRIYFHCARKGKRVDNIQANPLVCFETDELLKLYVSAEKPCSSDSFYRSAIAQGRASIVTDKEKMLHALRLLMDRYTGGKKLGDIPDDVLEKTAIVEIVVDEISGKEYLPPEK